MLGTFNQAMNIEEVKLFSYQEEYREQMISLWERSVRATHHFVIEPDIRYFKELVNEINFNLFSVYCLVYQQQKVLGFIGLSDTSIEMLFLDPNYIGLGLGKKLMQFALDVFGADNVEVNEQNIRAVQFYRSFGFAAYERLELDSNGKPYPVLKMRRK
jgi:putative acetyltransferase